MFNFIKNHRLPWLNYLYEAFLVYFVFIVFSMYEDQAPLFIPFLVTYLIGTIPMGWMIYKKNGAVTYLHLLIAVPFIYMTAMLFDFSIFISTLIAIVSIWRFSFHVKEGRIDNFEKQIFISIFIIPLCLLLNANFSIEQVFYLFFIQIICFPLIRRENIRTKEGRKDSYLWVFLSLVSFCFFIAFGIFLIFPFLLKGFIYLSSFIIVHVFGRIMEWLLSIVSQNGSVNELFSKTHGDESNEPIPMFTQEAMDSNSILVILGYVVTIIIIGFILSYLYKRLKNVSISPKLRNYLLPVDFYSEEGPERLDYVSQKYSSHNNKLIRKKMDRLEHDLAKHRKGRKPFETIDNWLTRIKVDENESKEIIEVYKRVRYGAEDINKQDKSRFIHSIKKVKGSLKK
ncbi:hypothetical protein [Chengkuizengella sediminis]|uniref:hypothetical protein n=1 Tax=Chengkuizengella sediminis TaxID=1885917 RepID=UPI00138A1B8F|nr:hypothetical protein [Chengkuizengella sediminis]NDI35533.1 hypothetical protein [Chengkuizengella sediminis]